MERLFIRGRLLQILQEYAEEGVEGEGQYFEIDPEALSAAIETEFGVVLPDNSIDASSTVEATIDLISSALATRIQAAVM
jgi:hypothetical protein